MIVCAHIYQLINVERNWLNSPKIEWNSLRVNRSMGSNCMKVVSCVSIKSAEFIFHLHVISAEHFICFHLNGTCFSSFFIAGMWWQLNKWIRALHCNRAHINEEASFKRHDLVAFVFLLNWKSNDDSIYNGKMPKICISSGRMGRVQCTAFNLNCMTLENDIHTRASVRVCARAQDQAHD